MEVTMDHRHIRRYCFFFFLSLVMISAGFFIGCRDSDHIRGVVFGPTTDQTAVTVTILQTSDVHDHASGYGPFHDYTPLDTSDNDSVRGGYARLAAEINGIRQERNNKNTLLFDSGDFFMGTVYDMTTQPPVALNFFKTMGYTAVTLGNHEFDWGPDGLAMLLNAGINFGFNVPIVASSMDASANAGLTALVDSHAIVPKLIVETENGVKIGILGMEGDNAIRDMPAAAPVTFIDPQTNYPAIQAMVDDLRNNDHVDLVVILSHGGINLDGTGDDADLAENVTGIDIIASGHYHTPTQTVFVKGPSHTLIFSPGAYGQWLSRLDISYSKYEKKIVDYRFDLIPIDDTIKGDAAVQQMVDDANNQLNAALGQNAPGGIGGTVSSTTFNLTETAFTETSLGDLSADGVRFTANQLAAATSTTLYDIGVVASGVIRDSLYAGKTGVITFSDAYNVLPLGISPLDPSIPGYPLMSIYVTGAEVRNACEISASISRMLGSDYYLNFSGLRYKYNPAATPGQTVSQVSITAPTDYDTSTAGTPIDITDQTQLYHIVVDYYALVMMNYATSMGLPIVPKDAAGNPIPAANFLNYRIDADPVTPGVQELKEWMALMGYFQNYIGTVFSGQIPASVYDTGGTGRGREQAIQ